MPSTPASTNATNDASQKNASEKEEESLQEKRLDSEQLLDGILLKVHRDDVELPDGKTAQREWIDHPGASAVVPLFEDGSTVLLRQFRYAAGRAFLEVPAGKIDQEGEAPEEVARRELEEEAGLRAGTLHRIGATYPAIGYSNEVIHLFVGEDLERTDVDREEGEFMEVVPMSFADALQKTRDGEILDAKSVAALTLAEAFVERRASEAQEKKLR
jgi:ADP-ribose pyrophosphatase